MPKLIFMCGKMAAGKTTLSCELATREDADLLVQDDFLAALSPGEILDIPDFVPCSSRLRDALSPHICALLAKGISVVTRFPPATRRNSASGFGRCLNKLMSRTSCISSTGPTKYANANSRTAAITFRVVVRRRRLPTSMRSRLT